MSSRVLPWSMTYHLLFLDVQWAPVEECSVTGSAGLSGRDCAGQSWQVKPGGCFLNTLVCVHQRMVAAYTRWQHAICSLQCCWVIGNNFGRLLIPLLRFLCHHSLWHDNTFQQLDLSIWALCLSESTPGLASLAAREWNQCDDVWVRAPLVICKIEIIRLHRVFTRKEVKKGSGIW